MAKKGKKSISRQQTQTKRKRHANKFSIWRADKVTAEKAAANPLSLQFHLIIGL